MTWNAAVYCTQVDPDTVMVRSAAPWFSRTCSAAWRLLAVLLQGWVRPVLARFEGIHGAVIC
jgi:hypothetical protein